jgi:hypothetical protein
MSIHPVACVMGLLLCRVRQILMFNNFSALRYAISSSMLSLTMPLSRRSVKNCTPHSF